LSDVSLVVCILPLSIKSPTSEQVDVEVPNGADGDVDAYGWGGEDFVKKDIVAPHDYTRTLFFTDTQRAADLLRL
jgi:hypothetical protein